MEPGKMGTFSMRYNASNEEVEELYSCNEDDPPTPQLDYGPPLITEAGSKKSEKPISILGKYFKVPKVTEKLPEDEQKSVADSSSKETTESIKKSESSGSPMRDYLSRISKRATYTENVSDPIKDTSSDTWKFFSEFKEKFSQAVEDLKSSRTAEVINESNDKQLSKDDSVSDSEDNSIQNELEQISLASTDNQVSSIASSLQNYEDLPLNQANVMAVDQGDTDNTISEDSDKKTPVAEVSTVKRKSDESLKLNEEIESGVEAIEETTVVGDTPDIAQHESIQLCSTQLKTKVFPTKKMFTFVTYKISFLTFILIFSFLLNQAFTMWNGFILGMWTITVINHVFEWAINTFVRGKSDDAKIRFERISGALLPRILPIKEHRPESGDIFESWINEYSLGSYNPLEYHISLTKTAFMRLEGKTLAISYTQMKIPKRHLWNEKLSKAHFHKTKTYDLSGAKITMLPPGLVSKRQWSKKYPICIILKRCNQVNIEEREPDFMSSDSSLSPKKVNKDDIIPTFGVYTSDDLLGSYENMEENIFLDENEASYDFGLNKDGLRKRTSLKSGEKESSRRKTSSESSVSTKVENDVLSTVLSSHKQNLPTMPTTLASELINTEELTDVEQLGEEGTSLLLYIFARTGREKLEWYRRLYMVVNHKEHPTKTSPDEVIAEKSKGSVSSNEMFVSYDTKEADSTSDGTNSEPKLKFTKLPDSKTSPKELNAADSPITTDFMDLEQEFLGYYKRVVQMQKASKSEKSEKQFSDIANRDVSWLNAILARFIFDAMKDKKIMDIVEQKIQRKLNTIKLPSFMSPLVVSQMTAGTGCPQLRGVAPPFVDDRGLWVDIDFFYDGGFTFVITTQLNLMKLKKNQMDPNVSIPLQVISDLAQITESKSNTDSKYPKPALYDSDCEDTAESSSEDESVPSPSPPPLPPISQEQTDVLNVSSADAANATTPNQYGAKKFIRIVDKITGSKYFQQVTENKYVKRAMEGVSNTDLCLKLEVKGLVGCLALNLPPPPHDRIWFGFRANPELWLKAKPIVGSRVIHFSHVTSWIEKRLCKEFEKVLVLPNMEDLLLPFLTPTPIDEL